jgi:hypothetical protein
MAKRVELRLLRFNVAGLSAVLIDAEAASVEVGADGSETECECDFRAGMGLSGFVTVAVGSSA